MLALALPGVGLADESTDGWSWNDGAAATTDGWTWTGDSSNPAPEGWSWGDGDVAEGSPADAG